MSPVVTSTLDDVDRQPTETDFGGREDVLFVTTQGTATLKGEKSAAQAIDTSSGDVLWSHKPYERYFDIEPLSDRKVLFLGADGPHGDNMWANIVNWRTGERIQRFRVPNDTHDIDALGDGRFAVADKEDHRLFVYDTNSEQIIWEYSYSKHYPATAGGSDFTHVNDIDSVDNGSLFLASPRNFDRVMLVNRSTKQPVWTLGVEDRYEILHEQHNPTLLSQDPPTVLVADSENNRIVEYRKTGTEWTQVWAYRGSLSWPRDADRLPNGNTLVVDSANQRVLEVTPGRDVVWEVTVAKQPYDADLLSLGEEPRGPSMVHFCDQFDGAEAVVEREAGFLGQMKKAVELLQWVTPWNVKLTHLLLISSTVGVGIFWAGIEVSLRRSYDRKWFADLLPSSEGVFTGLSLLLAGWLFVAPGIDRHSVQIWQSTAVLNLGLGILSMPNQWLRYGLLSKLDNRLDQQTKFLAGLAAVGLSLSLVATTALNAFYLSVGVLFMIEAVRAISTTELEGRIVRLHELAGYAVRLSVVLPILGLIYVSRGPSLTTVYLGLAVVMLGSAALPHTVAGFRVGNDKQELLGHLATGLRAVVLIVTLITVAGLVYSLLQPSTLIGVYAALTVILVRNAVALIRV